MSAGSTADFEDQDSGQVPFFWSQTAFLIPLIAYPCSGEAQARHNILTFFPQGRQLDFCGSISPFKNKYQKAALPLLVFPSSFFPDPSCLPSVLQIHYFDFSIQTDEHIVKPSMPLNSSFQCSPKVSFCASCSDALTVHLFRVEIVHLYAHQSRKPRKDVYPWWI